MSNILRVIISDASSNEGNATGEITTTAAPETGSFTGEKNNLTSGQASLNGFFIAIAIIIFAFVLGIGVILSRRAKIHRLRKTEVNKINHFKINARIKKASLYGLAFIVLFGTLGLLFSWLVRIQKEARATGLSITTEDTTIVIERDGGPVFATASSTITFNEATDYGFVLRVSALGDNSLKLVGGTKKIESLEEVKFAGEGKTLSPNTYGLLADWENYAYIAGYKEEYDQPIWGGIPVRSEENSGHLIRNYSSSTQIGDTETIDFGIYVDETIPAGTYEVEIEYVATKHVRKSLEDAYREAGKAKYNNYYAMQDMDRKICSVVEEEESKLQVIDKRDDKIYTIAKLKDGECWMTQNMDLAGGTELYSDDSNVPDGYTRADGVPYYTLPTSSEIGFNDNAGAYVYNTPDESEDKTDCGQGHPCYSYYSWLAATAGGETIESPFEGSRHKIATSSVCPKNWKLPTGAGYNSSFAPDPYEEQRASNLYKIVMAYYGVYNFSTYAGPGSMANFVNSGIFAYNTFYDDETSYASSSLTDSGSQSVALQIKRGYTTYSYFAPLPYGLSVRCVVAN